MATATVEGNNYTATSKICRLCAQEFGPFLNIFGTDMNLASKIKDLLPLDVDEWDDLPHKICFLCSAKVTELHVFVSKCVESQKFFHEASGKPTFKKTNTHRKRWCDQQKRIQQNDLCNQMAKKFILADQAHKSTSNVSTTKKINPYNLKELKVVLTRIDTADLHYNKGEKDSPNDENILNSERESVCNSPIIYGLRKQISLKPRRRSSRNVNVTSYRETSADISPIIPIQKNLCITYNSMIKSSKYSRSIKAMDTHDENPIIRRRKHPYLFGKCDRKMNPIYPCITEKAVAAHLHRLKTKLNIKYESLELAKKNGLNWVCVS